MNLGFYIDRTSDTPFNKEVFNLLNDAVDRHLVTDACIFYNEVDFNPNVKKFGSFNSTDLWFFSGTLVITALNLLPLATKIVNKIKLIFLFDKSTIEKGNAAHLMGLINLPKNVNIIASNKESESEYYRLTGKCIPILSKFNAENILKV
jgi:hypothetical protein